MAKVADLTQKRQERAQQQLRQILRQASACVSVSLSVSLYFKGDADDVKEGMLHCWEDYRKRWGSELRWFVEDDTGRFRTATEKALDYPGRKLTSTRPSERNVYWASYGGVHHEHASPWLFYGVLLRKPYQRNDLHAIRAAREIPADQGALDAFADMVKDWACTSRVFHGYAGFAFNESVVTGVAQQKGHYVLRASRRFAGVEVEDTDGTSMYVRDGIKSVNWLTLASDELLAKLGGRDAVAARFSDPILTYPIRDGLLIQSGPKPELGDVNLGERLPLYREVMGVLRPIRVARHPSFGLADPGCFGPRETDEWMRRLDDPKIRRIY